MHNDRPSGVEMEMTHNDVLQKQQVRHARWSARMFAFAMIFLAQVGWAQSVVQRHFTSPQEGVDALVEAVKTHDVAKINNILGPDGDRLVSSGDEVADKKSRAAFVKAFKQGHQLVPDGERQLTLVIGKKEWPLPIPLVKSDQGWYFDTQQGDDEILARRIGRNETAAVKVLLEIADSEREYAALNRGDDGVPEYAARIISSPGKRNGLYWPTEGNEPLSPIGELIAAAAAEGYTDADAMQIAPYHGYLYRILTKQGKNAVGGEQDYIVADRMTGGFAVLAWPARYGASGVMTFMVNHDGQVYEKNLGPNTAEIAAGIASFNPEDGWKPVDNRENLAGT